MSGRYRSERRDHQWVMHLGPATDTTMSYDLLWMQMLCYDMIFIYEV
jgi:hypothetical protein